MTGDLLFSFGLLCTGFAVVLVGLAHWNRWITPRGPIEPGSSAGRAYVFMPFGVAVSGVGVWFTAIVLDVSVPDAVLLPIGVATAAGFLLFPPTVIWQPEWLRPRWQRERIERFQRRLDVIAAARQQGHHLLVLLTYGDDEEPVATSADLDEAQAMAREAFADDPTADLATVLDLDGERIALTIDRQPT